MDSQSIHSDSDGSEFTYNGGGNNPPPPGHHVTFVSSTTNTSSSSAPAYTQPTHAGGLPQPVMIPQMLPVFPGSSGALPQGIKLMDSVLNALWHYHMSY